MSESLKRQAIKGTLWSSLERFSVQGVTFVVMIIMARLLTPADYGLVGMLTVFIAVSQSLVDSGFSQALIRKQDRSQTDNSTAFFFNIAVGFLLYLVLFLAAPLIASFYSEPILTPLLRVIGLSVLINSFTVVQRALLTVKIDFKTQAKASMTAALISGAAGIYCAYAGFGVWAIAVQQLVNMLINALLLWLMSHWRPSAVFSWQSFRGLFSFGSKLAISGILDSVYNNLYLIVIGKFFKASELGFYTRAHQFAAFPSSNVTGILQRVTFPVLCTIQDDDTRLRDAYRRFLRLSAFVIFPLMMGMAALARPLILILLKEQWLPAAFLLQILCFAMMWYPIHAINLNLLQVKGRSDIFLRLEVIKKIIGVVIMCITIPLGITAMCIGMVASSLIALVINTHYTGKLIQTGFFVQMRDLLPILLSSLAMGAAVYPLTWIISGNLVQLIAGTAAGIAVYTIIAIATRSGELQELKNIIRRK